MLRLSQHLFGRYFASCLCYRYLVIHLISFSLPVGVWGCGSACSRVGVAFASTMQMRWKSLKIVSMVLSGVCHFMFLGACLVIESVWG